MIQNQMVLDYIDRNGSITQIEAFKSLGVTRLSARIADLKESGVPIKSDWEHGVNRFGDKTRYKRYFRGKDDGGIYQDTQKAP